MGKFANKMKIYQGATYKYPIQIKINDEILLLDDIQKIEFAFGKNLIKTYPTDKTIQCEENKLTVVLSKDDTLSLSLNEILKLQARITFKDGSIKFTKSKPIAVVDTLFSEGEFNVM